MVAGGAGGNGGDDSTHGIGGYGGGEKGGDGAPNVTNGKQIAYGGTQTEGGSYVSTVGRSGAKGSFGKGADSTGYDTGDLTKGGYNGGGNGRGEPGGGGGGFYGGGSSDESHSGGAGGGGSGYVNTSKLTSAKTISGNQPFSNVAGTGNETGHSGNGAAKITPIN